MNIARASLVPTLTIVPKTSRVLKSLLLRVVVVCLDVQQVVVPWASGSAETRAAVLSMASGRPSKLNYFADEVVLRGDFGDWAICFLLGFWNKERIDSKRDMAWIGICS